MLHERLPTRRNPGSPTFSAQPRRASSPRSSVTGKTTTFALHVNQRTQDTPSATAIVRPVVDSSTSMSITASRDSEWVCEVVVGRERLATGRAQAEATGRALGRDCAAGNFLRLARKF